MRAHARALGEAIKPLTFSQKANLVLSASIYWRLQI
jgi:hypothetical protein